VPDAELLTRSSREVAGPVYQLRARGRGSFNNRRKRYQAVAHAQKPGIDNFDNTRRSTGEDTLACRRSDGNHIAFAEALVGQNARSPKRVRVLMMPDKLDSCSQKMMTINSNWPR
jgi:hypothetical protein